MTYKKMSDYSAYGAALDAIRHRVRNAMQHRVRNAVGVDCQVQYSAYLLDDHNVPIDNLDEVAASGRVQFVRESSYLFGGQRSRKYISLVVENPTWLDVCRCAAESITVTLDNHHVYLEGVEYLKDCQDGVKRYSLRMGS